MESRVNEKQLAQEVELALKEQVKHWNDRPKLDSPKSKYDETKEIISELAEREPHLKFGKRWKSYQKQLDKFYEDLDKFTSCVTQDPFTGGWKLSQKGIDMLEHKDIDPYFDVPEHCKTYSLKEDVLMHDTSYMKYKEFHELFACSILQAHLEGACLRRDLVSILNLQNGILDLVKYCPSTLSTAFNIGESVGIENMPRELLRWIVENERKTPYLEDILREKIEECSKRNIYQECIEDIAAMMKVCYPDRDIKQVESKIWERNIPLDTVVHPKIAQRLSELSLKIDNREPIEKLDTVCLRMKAFAKKHFLAMVYAEEFLEVEGGRYRLSNPSKEAAIFLDTVKSGYDGESHSFRIDVSLTKDAGKTSGSVYRLAELTDKQFNAWMLDALSHNQQLHVIDGTDLEKEELPDDIHPYQTFSNTIFRIENEWERPNTQIIMSVGQREIIEDVKKQRDQYPCFGVDVPFKDDREI